jgi:hypothetical protein
MGRSAVNSGEKNMDGLTIYKVDDGSTIEHDPDDGAVELAKKILDSIEESK